MGTTAYLVLLAVVAIAIYIKAGINQGSVTVFLVIAALAAIPWYFGTRNSAQKPSPVERVFATAWLWFRRLLCFSLGGVCLGGAGYYALSEGPYKELPWLAIIFLGCFGIALLYYGVVGGHKQHSLRDDSALDKGK